MDKITITRDAVLSMEREARNAYPKEACAVLLGNLQEKIVDEIHVLKNLSNGEEAHRFFRIDPLALYELEGRVEEIGKDIVGFFHTHTHHEAILSAEDEQYMIPGMVYFILSLTDETDQRIKAYEKRFSDSEALEKEIKRK